MDPFSTSPPSLFHTPSMGAAEDTFVQNVRSHLGQFLALWRQFGLDEEDMSSRLDELWVHTRTLLGQMYDEDHVSYQKVQKRVRAMSSAVDGLAKLLQVKSKEVHGPLFKKEKALREELERLTEIKKERLALQSTLVEEESEHRRAMILAPFEEKDKRRSSRGASCSDNGNRRRNKLPSEEDIESLRKMVASLKEERERREKLLEQGRRELVGAMERGEWKPETAFERDLVSREVGGLPLSEEFVDLVETTLGRVRSQAETREKKRKVLVERLKRLWRTLGVVDTERKVFSDDCHLETLEEMEAEVERLEDVRRLRMGPLVESLRREIEKLWDECHVPEPQRRKLKSFSEIDGKVLEMHEEEVEKWRRHHESVKPILEKVKKRQQLWDEMVTLETNSGNPDRFKNRGGNLLIEEKERKRLQKELPSLENDIFRDIEEFELFSGTQFLYYGEDYRDFVSNQWAQRLNQKEFQKLERRKQRSLDSAATVTTPTRRVSKTTPGCTPKKVSKSSEGSSASCTPLANRTPNRPNSVTVAGRLFSPRSAQKEDQGPRFTFSPRLCEDRQEDRRLDGTTYTDFADGIDESNFHSSAIERSTSKRGLNSSKRVLNASRRGKGKKVGILRKSARNMGRAMAKLTPKRGKLGLPFLI